MIARLRRLAGHVALVALVVAWFLLLRPVSLGGATTWVIIRGSSMLPTYQNGDLVVVRQEPAYLPGDVVAYRVAAGEVGAGHIVIHRVASGDSAGGFELRGDNNDAPDPWHPHGPDVVGRAWFTVPGFGAVMAWVHRPIIVAGLASAMVVAFVVARPSGRRDRRGDPSDASPLSAD